MSLSIDWSQKDRHPLNFDEIKLSSFMKEIAITKEANIGSEKAEFAYILELNVFTVRTDKLTIQPEVLI